MTTPTKIKRAARKPVAVVDSECGESERVLRRFLTVSEAEDFIAQRPDKAKVERGGYGIDAPEKLVNPVARSRA